MRYDPVPCCPPHAHPPRPRIPAGLNRLPRQIATFAEWRTAMLAAIREHEALARWNADAPGDLGVMLIDLWAYVLDVTAFYDARIAERAYLATAHEADVTAEIVSLLGYAPRPALAASVEVAIEARGVDPVPVPPRTGFRSEAFDAEPPQVFETMGPSTAWPQRNQWTLAPYRLDLFDGAIRFRPGEAPSRDMVLAITSGTTPLFAGLVVSVETETNPDGERYQRVRFANEAGLSALSGRALSTLGAWQLGFKAALSGMLVDGVSKVHGMVAGTAADVEVSGVASGEGWVILDGFYPQIAKGSVAALEVDGVLVPVRITANKRFNHEITAGTVKNYLPASQVTFDYAGYLSGRDMFLHVTPRLVGRPTRPAALERTLATMTGGTELLPPVAQLGAAPGAGKAIAVGLAAKGAVIPGTVATAADGHASFAPAADAVAFAPALQIPVRLFGNVVTAVRGETVANEVLGSGNASQAFPSFKLKKKPLTWVADGTTESGRRPQIDVAVGGAYWTWVETMYGVDPDAPVYTVRMEADGTAHVGFQRLPSGIGNVIASYRFGAGAAKPPPGSIKQFARPAKDLARVLGPLAPFGGADAEGADSIRQSAPASMLSLGRAVSAADYLAMARSFTGVANAAVSHRWDAAKLRVGIEIAIIADGGDPTGALRQFLELRSAPGVPVWVTTATALALPVFDVAVVVADNYVAEQVWAQATALLFDPIDGLLSPSRVPIGAPVYHSAIVAALHGVPGLAGVPAISLAGEAMGKALHPGGPGKYFDFLAHGRIV
jgi:hypothetical protein